MKCDSCGRRRGLFESFEAIRTDDTQLNVCPPCSALVYAIRGTIQEKAAEDEASLRKDLKNRQKKSDSNHFNKWFESRCDAWRRGER